MPHPALEVAEIFRTHGAAWRAAHAGHISLGQLKVMSAIEACRTAALGGHVERCERCARTQIAYNSCRNRHCPKCQGAAARDWLADREAELLPVPYFHVVFTLPAAIGDLAWSNKAVVYDLLFKAAAETLLTLAADPQHLGARIGLTAVLHTWGSALTHHPHVHVIVPGGGIALDGSALDRGPARLPSAGAGALAAVPAPVFRGAVPRPGDRAPGLLRNSGSSGRAGGVQRLAGGAAADRVGGLLQAPVQRPRGGTGLPGALHASGGDLKQPADRLRCGWGQLPLEGLSGQGTSALQGDAAERG